MKRILVLALALILAVSSLVVPSYAVETSSPAVVNLMTAFEYNLYFDDTFDRSSDFPAAWQPGYVTASWRWSIPVTIRYSKVVVTIQAFEVPTEFRIGYGADYNTGASTYLGSYGNFHQYSFSIFDITGEITCEGFWVNGYSGDFNIISAFGLVGDQVELTNVNYFANAMMYDNGDGEASPPDPEDFRWPVSVGSANNAHLPVVVDFSGPTGSDFYSVDYGEVFLKVPFDNTFKFFDSVSFVLYTCGEISSFGARLEKADGSVIDGLTSVFEYCGETQMVFELEEQFERIHSYIITVDTKGYDLTDSLLTLQFNIPSVFGSYIYQYDRGFYFQCSQIYGKYDIADIPWYSIFGHWLVSTLTGHSEIQFSNLIDFFRYEYAGFLLTLPDKITDYFSHSFAGFLVGEFQKVLTNLSNGFQSLLDALNSSGDNQGFQDDVGQQGDKLDDMQQVMDSVQKPDLGSINTDLSGIVSPADMANIAQVYTMVIGEGFVGQIMTMVVIMAMMSFVLFGKR